MRIREYRTSCGLLTVEKIFGEEKAKTEVIREILESMSYPEKADDRDLEAKRTGN